MGDNLPVVNLGTGKTAKQVVVGNHHTCTVLNDDTVKCWVMEPTGSLVMGIQLIEETQLVKWETIYPRLV